MTGPILAIWQHVAPTEGPVTILPDGCRDLILRADPGKPPRLLVSALASTAETIGVPAGTRFDGVRLRPGTRVDQRALAAAIARRDPDERDLAAVAGDVATFSPAAQELLGAIALSRQPGAGGLALRSVRTLQRACLVETGAPLRFWRQLLRARRAARAIAGGAGLAETAFDNGYADQAHMTRDIRRWFALTPASLRRDAEAILSLAAPGYD